MDTNTPAPVSTPPPPAASGEDKTIAIVSYVTVIGFIAAIVMHSSQKTKLGAFHLRQSLGIWLSGFGAIILMVIPIIGWIALPFFVIFMIVLWVIGLIAALNGQMKPVPVLGAYYQKWFASAFE